MVGYAAGLHYDSEHRLSIFVCYFWDYQQIAALFIGRTRKVIRRLFGKKKIAIVFQNQTCCFHHQTSMKFSQYTLFEVRRTLFATTPYRVYQLMPSKTMFISCKQVSIGVNRLRYTFSLNGTTMFIF